MVKPRKDNLFATSDPKTVSPARQLTYQSEKPVLQRVELKHLVLFTAIFYLAWKDQELKTQPFLALEVNVWRHNRSFYVWRAP